MPPTTATADHHEHRHRIERLAQAERRLCDVRQRARHEDALGVAADERDPAHNPHRPERDDERVHAEPDHQRAVDGAAGQADPERHCQPERDQSAADPSAPRFAGPSPS